MGDIIAGQLEGNTLAGMAIELRLATIRIHWPNASTLIVGENTLGAMASGLALLVEYTHILAESIEDLTLICITIDACILHSYNAHGTCHMLAQKDHIGARVFVGTHHGVQHPIGPEQEITIDCHGEGMLGCGMCQYYTICAIIIDTLDLIQTRIGPVKFLRLQIEGQCIGHFNIGVYNALHTVTRQIGTLYAWHTLIPIGPIDHAQTRLNRNPTWFILMLQLQYITYML